MKVLANMPPTTYQQPGTLQTQTVTLEALRKHLLQGTPEWLHPNEDVCRCLSQALNMDIPCRKGKVFVQPGESAVIVQVTGQPLPKGSKQLPPGCSWRITLATVL